MRFGIAAGVPAGSAPGLVKGVDDVLFQPTNSLRGAICKDLSEEDKRLFFPTQGNGYKLAQAICNDCPVQAACLAECLALEDPDNRYGVWAGTTARGRVKQFGGATAC